MYCCRKSAPAGAGFGFYGGPICTSKRTYLEEEEAEALKTKS
jgi:hypothetical protein